MAEAIEVASDVVAGSAALAGLILVYLGALSSSYASFDAQQRPSVRGRYQTRAWLAFVGFVIAILAAAFALIGKWQHVGCLAAAAIVLLIIALVWSAWIALATVREIR
jgi:hypothetical protein